MWFIFKKKFFLNYENSIVSKLNIYEMKNIFYKKIINYYDYV